MKLLPLRSAFPAMRSSNWSQKTQDMQIPFFLGAEGTQVNKPSFPAGQRTPALSERHCHCPGLRTPTPPLQHSWVMAWGANVGNVLNKILEMGGLPATNPATLAERVLPLLSWQEHSWDDDDDADGGLSPERVADLLYSHGPCVGLLWVISPWYHRVDADRVGAQVYTTGGCGRSGDKRRRSEDDHRGQVGWHAVVCVGYRFRDEEMHVLVVDNHTPTGPRRWILVEEFHTLYTLITGTGS